MSNSALATLSGMSASPDSTSPSSTSKVEGSGAVVVIAECSVGELSFTGWRVDSSPAVARFSGELPEDVFSSHNRYLDREIIIGQFSIITLSLPPHLFWTSSSLDVPAGVTQDVSSTFLQRCVSYFFTREGFSHSFPSSTVKSNFVF